MARLALTILKAATTHGIGATVTRDGDELRVREAVLTPVANTISERGYEGRVQLLLCSHNVTHADVSVLERIWGNALASPLSIQKLLELATEASSTPFGEEDDLAKWRQRIKLGLTQHNCFYVDSIPPGDPDNLAHDHVELRPVLHHWPKKLCTDPAYAFCEAPFKKFEPLPIDGVWVDLHFVDLDAHPRDPIDGSLADAVERHYWVQQESSYPPDYLLEKLDGLVALVGDPGIGKTTFVKWIARRLLTNPNGRYLLPLIVPLRRYVQSQFSGSILQYALQECGVADESQRKLWATLLSALAGDRREYVLLLLDGLDEVPKGDRYDKLLTEIEDVAQAFTTVVTSRPSGYPARLRTEKMYEISELSTSSSSKLIDKWFQNAKQPEDRAALLRQHLLDYPDLRQLARNPFLLTLLCGISCSLDAPVQRLPRTRRDLYDRTFALLAENEATANKAETLENHAEKSERLAYWLFREANNAPRYVFDSDDIKELFGSTALLTEFLNPRRLVKQWDVNKQTLFFIHTTIHEYLVARYLQHDERRDELAEVLRESINDASWQEVLSLLCSAMTKDDGFWSAFSRLAKSPDRFGLVHLRLSKLVGEVRAKDGGKSIVGEDLRERLWKDHVLEGECLEPYVNSLIELDATWFARRCSSILREESRDDGDELKEERSRLTNSLRTELLRSIRRAEATQTSSLFVDELLNDQPGAIVASYATEWLAPSDQKRLREALSADVNNAEKRQAIIRALGVSGDFDSVSLICEVADADVRVQRVAFEALALMGGDNAYAYLDSRMGVADVATRKEAVRALGMLRELRARDRLLRELALLEPGDEMNESVLEALCENPISSSGDVIRDLLRSDPNPVVRRDAAAVLEHSSEVGIAEDLAFAAQNDSDSDVRFSAIASLRTHGRKSDVGWMETLFYNNELEPGFRAVALDALMRLAELNPDLLDRAEGWASAGLSEKDYDVRLATVTAIGRLRLPFEKDCKTIAGNTKENVHTRAAACRTLAQLNDQDALDTLFALATSDKDRVVAEAAANALLEIDPFSLFFERRGVARLALRKYALSTGYLFYDDKVLNQRGEIVYKSVKGIGKDIPLQYLAMGHDGESWRGFRRRQGKRWDYVVEVVGIEPMQTELLLALADNNGFISLQTAASIVGGGAYVHASDAKRLRRNISAHFSKSQRRIREAFELADKLYPIESSGGNWHANIRIGFVDSVDGRPRFRMKQEL